MKASILKALIIAAVAVSATGCTTAKAIIDYSNERAALHANDPDFKYMDPNWHYHAAFPGDPDYNYAQVIGN